MQKIGQGAREMTYIQSFKEQSWLLPSSVEDLIPEDHICFLVESLVDNLDYQVFDIKYSGAGHPAYHPRVLLKLLVMGVLDRVRSSRRLARNARENVVYLYLSEKLTPDFRTISDFRKENPSLVKDVFKHTVSFAKQEGLLDLCHLSTDGSKVKANASNRRVLTKDELSVLLKFVDEELAEWAKKDTQEDAEFGDLRGSDQLPKQSKKTLRRSAQYYIKKVRESGHVFKEEVQKDLENAKQKVEEQGLSKVSITDPESRFMKNKKGRIELSYNPQLTVDKKGFVLANDVCQSAHDAGQLQPQVIQTEENLGSFPEGIAWSFDSGYFEGANIKCLADKKIDGYIPDNNEKKEADPFDKKHFQYNAVKDEFQCPENHAVPFMGEHFDKQKSKVIRVYKGIGCSACQSRDKCTKRKDGIRYLKMYPYEIERNIMVVKMKTPQAQEIYKLRQQIVEPAIGDIKENQGLRAFLARGLQGAKTEFNLACAARNLRKIWVSLKRKEENGGDKVKAHDQIPPPSSSLVIYQFC
jgi:transposase